MSGCISDGKEVTDVFLRLDPCQVELVRERTLVAHGVDARQQVKSSNVEDYVPSLYS